MTLGAEVIDPSTRDELGTASLERMNGNPYAHRARPSCEGAKMGSILPHAGARAGSSSLLPLHPILRHTIVHQFDPERFVVGGIDGFISDIIRDSDTRDIRVIGVTHPSSDRRLGHWVTIVTGSHTIEFMPIARLTAGDQARRVPHTLQVAIGLARFSPDVRGDILHFHRADLGLAAVGLRRRARGVVQFIHGSMREALRSRMETFWRFAPGLSGRVEQAAARAADLTFVMHGDAAEHLSRFGRDVRHGRNWFDESVFYPGAPAAEAVPVIAWAGRLEGQKDPMLAVETLAELRRRGRAFHAWLAGSGALRADVEAALERHGLSDVVEVLGVLEPPALAERLRSSRAFLVSSRWEGIPRVVIEALACGCPVVGPDVGDLRRMIGGGSGRLVDRTPAALADGLEAMFDADPSPAAVAGTVDGLRSGVVIPELFHEIEHAFTP